MQALAGRTIAVTGAGGYVAGALVHRLDALGCRVLRVSRSTLSPTRDSDMAADIGRPETWDAVLTRADTIIHLAAATSTYEADRDPAANVAANVTPLLHLITAARRLGVVPRVVLAGTSTQVGLASASVTDETMADHPVTVYCLNKLMAERHLLLAARAGHVQGTCLRLANVYGPSPQASASADRGILNRVTLRAMAGETITVFGGGDYLRDYIFIDDVVEAFVMAAADIEPMNGRFFNLATGRGVPFGTAFRQAAATVARLTGRQAEIIDAPWPEGSAPIEFRSFASTPRALTDAIGWRPTVDIEAGIERTVRAFMGRTAPCATDTP